MTLTATTIQERYKQNYDRIAREHVAYARTHNGANPFMEPALVETLEAATEALVRRHVTEGSAILDAGHGPGTLLNRLTGYERTGVDMSSDYCDYASELLSDVEIWRDQLENITQIWPASFDAVLCCDVLEHVLDEHAVLRELDRMLKPGGKLIVRVPQEDDLSIYLDGEYEYVHLRQFAHASLRLLLEKIHGLTVVETDTIWWPSVGHEVWTELHAVAVKP